MNGVEHFREAERLTMLALERDNQSIMLFNPETRATMLQAALVHATLAQATSASHLLHRMDDLTDAVREGAGLDEPLSAAPVNHPVRFAEPVTGAQPILTVTDTETDALAS